MQTKLLILYVDDDKVNRELMEKYLKHEFDVVTVRSVMQAICKLNLQKFDAVLSNLNMPNASGTVVMEHCQTKQIPCALITAQKFLRRTNGIKCVILDRCQLNTVPQWIHENTKQEIA